MTSGTNNTSPRFSPCCMAVAQRIQATSTGESRHALPVLSTRAQRSLATERWRAAIAGMVMFASCIAADAAPLVLPSLAPDFAFIQHARAPSTDATSLGLGWQVGEPLQLNVGNVSVYVETSVGRWSTDGERGRDVAWITQVALTPVLRFQPYGHSWFAELGIGANYLGPIYRTEQKRFSTAFNFGDHVGVVWKFGEDQRQELALRLQHFSNAGIRQPNPGENFWQLRYTRSW
jgi:lipid A 3-O-deacylase